MTTWYSSKGSVRISDMDNGHLVNTIKLLQRRAYQTRSNRIVQALMGLASEDDGTLEGFLQSDVLEHVPSVYYAMTREANSRGLWFPEEPLTPLPPYMMLWETEEDDRSVDMPDNS